LKPLLLALLLYFSSAGLSVCAQTKSDEGVPGKLPQDFCGAWAKHDGRELAKIMADDVDFLTVATTYLHGRSDFEKFHTRLLSRAIQRLPDHSAPDHRSISAAGYGCGSLELENGG
jgi:hypothetical protein